MKDKMQVEIWSDVMCPFCYIGKRKFETALAEFEHADQIEVVWKSYQLNPDIQTDPSLKIDDHLAKSKGVTLQVAHQMNERVSEMAKAVGLEYHLDQAVVANSFRAHRFSHFAKEFGKQNEAEEVLFRAYFTDGKNTDDLDTLIQLGTEIGLDPLALKVALESDRYTDEVNQDIYEASQVGVRGVPFFLFNKAHKVPGAHESRVFLNTLKYSFASWQKEKMPNSL